LGRARRRSAVCSLHLYRASISSVRLSRAHEQCKVCQIRSYSWLWYETSQGRARSPGCRVAF
jgi:hypothetical protein